MKRFSSSTIAARLLALFLGLGSAPPLLAQALPFHGRWLQDGPADGNAPAALLTIKDGTLSRRGPDKSKPACVQRFVVKPERPGTVYVDGRGTPFVAGNVGSIPTWLLALSGDTCGGPDRDLRIRYPLIYDVSHIEVIEYDRGRPVSSLGFKRKK